MRNSPFWWILIGAMILLDFYVFQGVRFLTSSAGSRTRTIIHSGYWILSAAALITLLLLPYLHLDQQAKMARSTIFALIAGLFFAKLIVAIFLLVDDIRRLIQWGAGKVFYSNTEGEKLQEGERISRSLFLSWAGMIAGGGLYGTLLYGFGNKYRYQLNRVPLAFSNLPAAFRGLKIVHISDIHSGSFTDKAAVKKGVEKIMAQKPDLILFTGDLVNNTADEMDNYIDLFSQLKAPMGVYSTLGNHDYGDYVQWTDRTVEHDTLELQAGKRYMSPLQRQNLERLKQVHAEMGWRLLMNEHVVVEKEGQQIAILGIENWSAKARFPKYGKMSEAYAGAEKYPFKILLSHDPSHWDAEVRKKYSDVDLMLSGHTHGFQFGIDVKGFRWSPVQYVYDQWAGLYEQGNQKLYVNRGYGFIGYPGRVGVLPEITLLELA